MTVISNDEVKLAGSQWEEFSTIELFSGDTPLPVTTSEVIDDTLLAAGVPAYSVMGRDPTSKKLVYALTGSVDPADDIAPIGITGAAVLAGASVGNVPTYRAGCFNPAALNWPASYSTDALKRLAFEGSTAANIVIQKNPVA